MECILQEVNRGEMNHMDLNSTVKKRLKVSTAILRWRNDKNSDHWRSLGYQRSCCLHLVPPSDYKLLSDSDYKLSGILSRNKDWD